VATAHGHATLMLDGTFGTGDHAVEAAAEQAAAAALALIAGREALSGPALERDLADEDDPVQRRPVVVLDRI
jgi:hypothetical protein